MIDDASSLTDVPKVTVFVPAYNAARYVEQAVASILAQTWTDFELLVIDDGSTDDTPNILSRLADRDGRIRVIRHDNNRGRPYVRNEGLDEARGEYMALLDADDYCVADRLAQQVQYLDAHPGIDVLGGLTRKIDDKGAAIPGRRSRDVPDADELSVRMLFDCPIDNPTVMARTAVLRRFGYDNDYAVAQDYEMWVRMRPWCRFAILPRVVTLYRQHAVQASAARADEVAVRTRALRSRQLLALGIRASEWELKRHDLLFRNAGRRQVRECLDVPMDGRYLATVDAWFQRLLAANARHGCYPQATLDRMVGARWWFVCRKTVMGGGYDAWWWVLVSPLSRAALRAGWYRLCRDYGIHRRGPSQ